jgi:hypothetical protein
LYYHVYVGREKYNDESWDRPLALVCSLNGVTGWREEWGKPRGKWHREYRPPEWIRLLWPSDDADQKLRDEVCERDRAFLAKHVRTSSPGPASKPRREEGPPLSEYADTWLESGRDLSIWRKKNPKLAGIFDGTFFQGHSVTQLPDGRIVDRLEIVPFLPRFSTKAATFGFFLLSPRRDSLGKCLRCGRYFLNFVRHERKYCKHRCAAHDSAVKSTRTKRDKEKAKRLSDARRAIRKLAMQNPMPNWKEVIAAEAGVKRNWVTRAINRGKLEIPKKILKSEAARKEK